MSTCAVSSSRIAIRVENRCRKLTTSLRGSWSRPSTHTPGVAWVKEDGKREPVRARAFHVTDHNLAVLEAHVTGRRARVYPFPGPTRGGEAA